MSLTSVRMGCGEVCLSVCGLVGECVGGEICTCAYMHACFVCLHVHIHVWIYASLYINVFLSVCTCVSVYIYIYTGILLRFILADVCTTNGNSDFDDFC